MTKILVTGSSGFVARHLIPKLGKLGYNVNGLDTAPDHGHFGNEYYHHYQGDIRDSEAVSVAMQGAKGVIHLAAEHHDFGVSRDQFFDVNESGTRTILDAAHRNSVDHFVFYSSVAVYGTIEKPSHEDTEPKPDTAYGQSKLAAENQIRRWQAASDKRRLIIIRPTVVFGAHNYANMYKLIDTIARRRYIRVGKGNNIKSIAYVDNLVDATVFLWNQARPGLTLVNFADTPHLTSSEIVETIFANLGKSPRMLSIPRPVALVAAYPMDLIAKATKRNLPITSERIRKFTSATWHDALRLQQLGFRSTVDTREGIRAMVNWYMATEDVDLRRGPKR